MTNFDDRDGLIWHDGELRPWRETNIHILNHGLHYASCVFEGVRAYGGRVFKNTEHNERLRRSAELIGFEVPYSTQQLDDAVLETLRANDIKDGYIRPVAWRGSEQMEILSNRSKVHVAIACWPWPSLFGEEAKKKGLNLVFADWRRPAPDTAPTASKAAGLYMICSLSKNKAVAAGYQDALMLDYRGYIAEATGANIFLLMDGKLHTPTPDCFLDGITRRTVIELARARGMDVIERHIKPEELADATGAFLTGTAAEVTPIASITDDKGAKISYNVADAINILMDDYHKLTRGEK